MNDTYSMMIEAIVDAKYYWDNRYYEKVGSEVKDITDDIDFDLPSGWEYIRLLSYVEKITDYVASGSFASLRENVKYYKEKNYAILVKTQDFQNNFSEGLTYTDEHGYNFLSNSNLFGGELLLSNIGSIGKVFIVPYLQVKMTLAPNAIMVKADSKCRNWLRWFFESSIGFCALNKISSGTTMKKFNKTDLARLLIPVPPLSEQRRIIAQIEELFAQIDIIEQNQADIDVLYDEFRKRTLTLAIQGKLVPQDPNDEPASVLLERIRAEKKAKLGKKFVDSYIYKGDDNYYYEKVKDSVKEISAEIPFDVPESWQWIRIDNLFQHNTGKALNSSNTKGILHPYITTSNVYWGHFCLDCVKEMPFTEDEFSKCSIVPGDLLVCEGGDVGRAAIWEKDIPMCIQNHIHRLRAYYPVCTQFYYFAFFVYKSIGLIGGKGIGIQGLSSGALGKWIFPLPPLAEQERIVKQVEIILEKLKDEG